MKTTAVVSVLLGALAASEARAADDEWQFGITPYLWLPYVDAKLGFETAGSGGSAVEMTNLLEHLKAALFLNAAATKGNWGVSLDLVYCDFNKSSSQVTNIDVPLPDTTTSLTGSMLSLLGSYALQRSPNSSLDLLTGVRYTHISATLDWSFAGPGPIANTGSAAINADLWDGVVGFRGRFRPAESAWFAPLYLDVGTGTSKFTWQAMLGAGYAFNWGDLLAVYRQLAFQEHDGAGLQHLSFSGPAIGATFRF